MTGFEYTSEPGGPATFTPLDADGRPTGEPITAVVASFTTCHLPGDPFAKLNGAMLRTAAAARMVTITPPPGTWARLYEVLTDRRWRPSKAQRRRGKATRLAQRRAARALPHMPGRVWHVDMHLYAWSVAETARGLKTRPHPRTGYVHISKGDNSNGE